MKFKLSDIIDLALEKYLRVAAKQDDKHWFSCAAIFMAATEVVGGAMEVPTDQCNTQQFQFSGIISKHLDHVAFEGFNVRPSLSTGLFREFEPDSRPTEKSQYARAMWLTFLQLWLRENPDMDIIEFNIEKYK